MKSFMALSTTKSTTRCKQEMCSETFSVSGLKCSENKRVKEYDRDIQG